MKVALPVHHFDPLRGGLESWCWQYAHWLAGRGHEVHVYCFHAAQTPSVAGLVIHRTERPRARSMRREALAHNMARICPDIIHDTGCAGTGNVYHPLGGSVRSTWRETLRSIPIPERWFQHWVPRKRRWLRAQADLERRHVRSGASLVVAISERVRADLIGDCGLAPERIRVIPNGVDLDHYHVCKRKEARSVLREAWGAGDQTVFLIVAHNFALKGVDTLLRALVRCPGILVVVGRGEVARYARRAARLGVASRVFWAGLVDDTRPYFWSSDVYVHPAFYDPCSLSTLEAMACGLPVITTLRNGVSEMVTPGREGELLAEADDVEGLSDMMIRMTDAERRRHMSAAAVARAGKFDLADSFQRLESLYPEAMRFYPLCWGNEDGSCPR